MTSEKSLTIPRAHSYLLLASLAVLLVGERFESFDAQTITRVIAALLFCVGLGTTALRTWTFPAPKRLPLIVLLSAYGISALAIVAYGVGQGQAASGPYWVASAALGISAVLLTVMNEIVCTEMRASGFIDTRRTREAATVALTLAFAFGSLVALNYAAKERRVTKNFSVGGDHKPSAATLNAFQASETPIEVVLFFEEDAPALNVVRSYVDGLKDANVKVSLRDAALDLDLAKELKVSQNGTVAMVAKNRSEKWVLGQKPEAVQKKLKRLDGEIQKRVAKLSSSPKTVYITTGHGEKATSGAGANGKDRLRAYKKILELTNAKVKNLGAKQGLMNEIPDDAGLVVIIGPQNAFLDAESASLARYMERGGSLFVAVDPKVEHGLDAVLEFMGVTFGNDELASTGDFVRDARTNADHAFIFASSFSNHPSIKTLNDFRGKVALLMKGARSLNSVKGSQAKVKVIGRTPASVFDDKDRDRLFDKEKDGPKKVRSVVAASTLSSDANPEGSRAILIGDSDALTDRLLENDANQAFAYETALWLLGDEDLAGALSKDDDAVFRQSADEEDRWFISTTFLVPGFVLIFGLVLAARRRQRARQKTVPKDANENRGGAS